MFEKELEAIRQKNRFRSMQALASAQTPVARIGKQETILFCSNNYLGLAEDKRLADAAQKACVQYGFGAGASRLLSGNTQLHESLEADLARFRGTQSALLFGSGYQANCGLIPALVGEGDLIVSDERNHASLIDGCRLSRAKIVIYPHRDVVKAGEVFEREGRKARRRLLITEGVFSMEGSLAPLPALWELAKERDALFLVDDAHGLGVLGPQGKGSVAHFQLPAEDPRLIQMATLGKALGCFGAFVCGSQELRDLLINKSRTFIFSTGLPPAVCAAAKMALEIIGKECTHQERLGKNCAYFSKELGEIGCAVLPEATDIPIQPVMIGQEAETLALAERLFHQGIFARAIRPPTVAEGLCRIRFSLMATHESKHFDLVMQILRDYFNSR